MNLSSIKIKIETNKKTYKVEDFDLDELFYPHIKTAIKNGKNPIEAFIFLANEGSKSFNQLIGKCLETEKILGPWLPLEIASPGTNEIKKITVEIKTPEKIFTEEIDNNELSYTDIIQAMKKGKDPVLFLVQLANEGSKIINDLIIKYEEYTHIYGII